MTDDQKQVCVEKYPEEIERILIAIVCCKDSAIALQKANFTGQTIFYWSGERVIIIMPGVAKRDEIIAQLDAVPAYNVEQMLRFYAPLMQIAITNFQDRLMVFSQDNQFKCVLQGNLADSLANDLLYRNAAMLERIEEQKKSATLQ
jgi:ABC-type phosphate transport system ATPase subunit